MIKNVLILVVLAGALYVASEYLLSDTTKVVTLAPADKGATSARPAATAVTSEIASEAPEETTTSNLPNNPPEPAVAATSDVAFTIDTSTLSDLQRSILSTLGIDESIITVTQTMYTCAEGKLGSTRLNEIKGGSLPSFSESFSLFNCY